MLYLETVLNVPIAQSFIYSFSAQSSAENADSEITAAPGMRAEVRFGSRKMTAFIIRAERELPPDFPLPPEKIKPILRLIDKEPLFTQEQIQLSSWIASYYICSQGEALSAMLPSGIKGTPLPDFSSANSGDWEQKTLSAEQKAAAAGILSGGTMHYLYGRTGSGKTEVFLHAAEQILARRQGVIYLVPEIGLTQQVEEAVLKRFGQTAAVLHSGLTPSQKLTEWKRILRKEARVVIGARSAVFAPVPDLGLIIMDEEHDPSYKSGNTPRYHARQIAMHRASQLSIPFVMGSATPSVESWHYMANGLIKKHVLSKRLAGGQEPEIIIEDMSEKTNNSCLSKRLEEEIRQTLSEKRQTILFLNRRGFSHFFRCISCGFELTCKNCSVSLTYHRSEHRLRCHYCGWSVAPPQSCPECGSLDIGYYGFGTEFIENEVRAKFPSAKTDRIDTDTLVKKDDLQQKIRNFREGKTDILLGTQMVAKGLNFPNLKLVGVVMADTGMHMPDFRAAERTFSLIVQVAGRAGRFFPDGKVIVQTFSPNAVPVAYSCAGRIEDFYSEETEQRRILDFPPFSRLLRLVFRSANKTAAEHAAAMFRQQMRQSENSFDILGPSECPLAMVAANYRFQLLLKSTDTESMKKAVRLALHSCKFPAGVYIEVDVDPLNLL
ncbi:MAG: primosomal protein N' [Bacteroides sp.]|nr:primosomal protein N' [Prevotella sp.]MCM1407298.1 primosomal protein N' [Treponema brennaborense]MCM1469786.1 primosomal protein N' [Bacteroides sp.]